MSKHSSENYLDNLLNSVDDTDISGEEIEFDNEFDNEFDKEFGTSFEEPAEDAFLRQFESELESEAYNEYIADFETELENEQSLDMQSFDTAAPEIKMADDDASLDDMLDNIEQIESDEYDKTVSLQTYDTEDTDLGSLEELNSAVNMFDVGLEEESEKPKPVENGDDGLMGALEEDFSGDDISGISDIGEISDIGGISDNGGIDDINEIRDIDGDNAIDGDSDINDIDNLDALGDFEQLSEEELQKQEEVAEAAQEEKKAKRKRRKKEKTSGGFLERFKLLLFGADEEEAVVDLSSLDHVDVDNLSDEQKQILAELGGASEEADSGKGKKKEKKKKEKKPKKEKPPKEKKEKPKKVKKPKKEKPPKEKDNTPPLPKGPVIMIWLMAASLVVLVVLATNLTTYQANVSEAQLLYDTGSYTEAYKMLKGLQVKEKDQELYHKASVLAAVTSEIETYETFYTYGRRDLALDALICAAGRYELNQEHAQKYGCEEELEALGKQIKKKLKSKFKMKLGDAVELYNRKNRNSYTIEVRKKIEELGLGKD